MGAVYTHRSVQVKFNVTYKDCTFIFFPPGRITGGSLKTSAQADRESIQAGWFSAEQKKLQYEVGLRARDILPLVGLAAKWYQQPQRPFTGLPIQAGHVSSSLRLVAVHEDRY